jgi:hypothetical protein
VKSSCKLGNELSGSIKCWELPNGCTTCGLSSGTQLHRVSTTFHIAMCLVITKELVCRDTTSTIVSTVICASSWVGESKAPELSLLTIETRRR